MTSRTKASGVLAGGFFAVLYQAAIKQVARAFSLCMRRLKPAATKNYLIIATWYYMLGRTAL
jgi:hypothetical protein